MLRLNKVKIVEVGLRDGLQNEKKFLTVEERYQLFEKLSNTGLRVIEIGSFVSPKWVPQMQGTEELLNRIQKKYDLKKIAGPVLVPNAIGMQKAIENQVKEVAVFISSSEAFSKANINCTIAESLERVQDVVKLAKKHRIKVRGYLSVCFGCPYEGYVDPKVVVNLAKKLYQMGCYEISIGDTIGCAYPDQVAALMKMLKRAIPVKNLAGHFHDTRGLAIANIQKSLELGIRIFDSSIGGLGGCPYAKGATGNVATEDVVHLCEMSGYKTNVDSEKLFETYLWLEKIMDRPLESKISKYYKKSCGG